MIKDPRVYLPVGYIVVAIAMWLNFLTLPPDGLANFGIALVVFPYTILDRLAGVLLFGRTGHFVFAELADRLGLPSSYHLKHAYFYFPGVVIIAGLLYAWASKAKTRSRS